MRLRGLVNLWKFVGVGRGSIFEILGTLGTRKFFWKVVFSRVLGSRFFANSFFIVFSKLFHSFLILIENDPIP